MGIFDFFKGSSENQMKNGKKEGLWKYYHESGQLREEGNYKDGEREGLWKYYHESGQLEEEINFKDGKEAILRSFEEFSKSIDTSSFSETQKKSTEKLFSDINKRFIEEEEDKQLNTKKINKVEDVIKDGQSNSEERLDIFVNGKEYRVTGSENIRKTKELNDPKKYDISSLFTLKEYYDNGIIKKSTEKLTVQNIYIEHFYDENGVLKKENRYLINENRLCEQYIHDDSENYQHNLHYEGGEIRKSFYVDGLQEGIEKVFDKNGNIIEEHTYKRGRNTYYKRFIDGKVSEESVMEEELKEDEEEIMQIAKSIDVELVEILPTDLSEFEGESYFDVTEDFAVLLKNGKEVARGYVHISHNFNYWRDDDEEHEPQLYNEVMIVNGKQFTDYDDTLEAFVESSESDDTLIPSWSELPKIIATFWDDGEAEEFFKEYVKIKCKKH